jgi:hypothetical protein
MDIMPRSTIVMVPRETFSDFASSMDDVARHRERDARMIVIDAASPGPVRRRLEQLAVLHDVALLRVNRYLSPNESRNLAMTYVDTEFVVFIDNDTRVQTGWLRALEDCAIETGAAIVAPTTVMTERGKRELHQTGGLAHITEVGGRRTFENVQDRRGEPVAGFSAERSMTEEGEFHCTLVDCSWFRKVGGLDEGLPSLYDHSDLAMRVRAAGGQVWFEPGSVISYGRPMFISWRDVPFYVLRWCDDWNERSGARFVTAWKLDIDPSEGPRNWAKVRRRYAYRPYVTPFNRIGRFGRPVVAFIDHVIEARVVASWQRSCAEELRVDVVHRASWDARPTSDADRR